MYLRHDFHPCSKSTSTTTTLRSSWLLETCDDPFISFQGATMKDRYCIPFWQRIKAFLGFGKPPDKPPEKPTVVPQVVAVAGVGDVGKYIAEEIQKASEVDIIVLTRNVRNRLASILMRQSLPEVADTYRHHTHGARASRSYSSKPTTPSALSSRSSTKLTQQL